MEGYLVDEVAAHSAFDGRLLPTTSFDDQNREWRAAQWHWVTLPLRLRFP